MLHKNHCWGILLQKLLYLHARIDINKVEGFIPDIKMGFLAQAFGDEDFLFLPAGVILHILFKLDPFKTQFPEDRFEQCPVYLAVRGKPVKRTFKERCILRNIRYDKPGADGHGTDMRDIPAVQQLQDAAFAASVPSCKCYPFALPYLE